MASWTVEGGVSGTSISATGRLTVAADETAVELTVRATSTFDATRSGTAIVTVPVPYFTPDPEPTVTGVTVSPDAATVERGGNQDFTATVSGTDNPPQTVTWAVEGGGSGTSISATGRLSVSADETAASLTVRATSTFDATKSGTAIVTVTAPDPGAASFNIGFADFQDMAPDITGPTVYVTGEPVEIVVIDPHLYTSIRWFLRGNQIAEGPTLALGPSVHNNMVGIHSVTVEVRRGTALYSAIITFRVMP